LKLLIKKLGTTGKYVFNANEDIIDTNNIAESCNSESVNGSNPCTLYFCDSNDGKTACTEQEFVGNFVSEIYSNYHLKCDAEKKCQVVTTTGYYINGEDSTKQTLIFNNGDGIGIIKTPEPGYYINAGNVDKPIIFCGKDGICNEKTVVEATSCSKAGDILKDSEKYYYCYKSDDKIEILNLFENSNDEFYNQINILKNEYNPFTATASTADITRLLFKYNKYYAILVENGKIWCC